MIFRGANDFALSFFSGKTILFYEKYGSFLEKNTNKRYDKM